jgi:Tfp pilus assembly protein PilP
MRRNSRFLCGAVVAVAILALPLVGAAQESGESGAEGVDVFSEESKVDLSQIDQILRGEQEVIQGGFFTYDPAGRRDPFRSLRDSVISEDELSDAPRPPGLPGMLIEEIEVQGIIETPDGILAFVRGKDNISYIIRRGTALYNGEVKEILPGRVVFRQQVNDPQQVQPYQDVVREIAD